jgi:hypothetical protein
MTKMQHLGCRLWKHESILHKQSTSRDWQTRKKPESQRNTKSYHINLEMFSMKVQIFSCLKQSRNESRSIIEFILQGPETWSKNACRLAN